MDINAPSAIQSIDVSKLTAIVRESLRRDHIQILDWHASLLGGGAGNPVTAGLYRVEGVGQGRDERLDWSVILKIVQSPANVGSVNMGERDDQTHWNYWRRELLVYQSGLLETLPEGLAAPRCYSAVELPGNVAWLWLEDIGDSHEGAWSLERYAMTARHLGRLNGSYLSARPLPAFPWFSRQRARQWIAMIPWQAIPWQHSRVLARYPRPEANSFRRMLLENEHFLAKLDLLPKTVCHGDTYPTNFKSRHLGGGQEQTVAIDWALVGIEPLGDDLGQLAFGAQMNLKEEQPADIDNTLFESYLDGLRDSGCRVDPRWVRFGYTASAALRVGLFQLYLLGEELELRQPVDVQIADHPVVPDCFEVTMAREAYELLEIIQ